MTLYDHLTAALDDPHHPHHRLALSVLAFLVTLAVYLGITLWLGV